MAKARTKRFKLSVALLAILAAVGTGILASVQDTTKSLFDRTTNWAQNWLGDIFPAELPQADKDAALSILVAHLYGDQDGSQTDHLRKSLHHALDLTGTGRQVQVIGTDRVLKHHVSNDLRRQRESAEAIGREWLKQSGAELLIWGEVAGRDKVLRINFLPSDGEISTRQIWGELGKARRLAESYTFSDRLVLSADFTEDLGFVIVSRGVAILARRASNGGSVAPDLLREIYPRLIAIGTNPVVVQSRASCDWKFTIAVVMMTLSEQKDEANRLNEAITNLRSLIADAQCAVDRDTVAAASFVLGHSLSLRADRENPAQCVVEECLYRAPEVTPAQSEEALATYREAIVAYNQALKDWSRERMPLEWAWIQQSLGDALLEVAQLEGSISRYEEAFATYREALKERTRQRAPRDWARTQFRLGLAIAGFALRYDSFERLEEAIAAYREALRSRRLSSPRTIGPHQRTVSPGRSTCLASSRVLRLNSERRSTVFVRC